MQLYANTNYTILHKRLESLWIFGIKKGGGPRTNSPEDTKDGFVSWICARQGGLAGQSQVFTSPVY